MRRRSRRPSGELIRRSALAVVCAAVAQLAPAQTAVDKTGQQFLTDTDIGMLVEDTSAQLLAAPVLGTGPRIAMHDIRNRTKDHIDGLGILRQIGDRLLNAEAATILDREALVQVAQENALSESLTKTSDGVAAGKLLAADYLLSGQLTEISKKVGGSKQIYYVLTIRMIDVRTSEVAFATEAEVKKRAKRSFAERLGVK